MAAAGALTAYVTVPAHRVVRTTGTRMNAVPLFQDFAAFNASNTGPGGPSRHPAYWALAGNVAALECFEMLGDRVV